MAGVHSVEVAWPANNLDEEFTENFDGATLQPFWHQLYGTIGTSAGQGTGTVLYSGANNQFNGKALALAAGCANGTITCTFATLGTLPSGKGLLVRVRDETNHWRITPNTGLARWELQKLVNGAPTTVGFSAVAPANGDVIRVELLENSLVVKVNGAVQISVLDTAYQTEGRCGLFMDGTMKVDNLSAALTWTDISAYVRGFSAERGRETSFDRFEAGEVRGLILNNEDRRFEPQRASSPYYPYVLPGRHLRVILDGDVIWRGHLDDWPAEWYQGTETDIEVECSGVFESMAQATLKSTWEFEHDQCLVMHRPVVWLRLSDLDDADTIKNEMGLGGTRPDGLKQTDGLVQGDKDGATQWPDVEADPTFPASTAPQGDFSTVELVARIPRMTEPTTAKIRYLFSSEQIEIAHMARSGNGSGGTDEGKLQVYFWDGNNTLRVHYTTKTVDNDRPHHIVVTLGNTGVAGSYACAVYVDGVEVTGTTSGTYTVPFPTATQRWKLGRAWTDNAGWPLDGITLDEVKVYRATLTTTDVVAHYQAARKSGKDERSDLRLRRIAWAARWPDTRLVADTGLTLLQAEQGLQELALLEYAQLLSQTEGGQMFEQRDGKVRFTQRFARHLDAVSTTPQATFGDVAGESEYAGVTFVFSKERVRNVYDGHRINGAEVHIEAVDSKNQVGRRQYEENDLRYRTDQEVQDKGTYLVSTNGQVKYVISEIVVEPVGPADPLWTLVRTLDINHRIRVRRRPGDTVGETPIEQDAWIEKVAHEVNPDTGKWTTRYAVTPTEATLVVLDASTAALDSARLGW